MTARVIISLSDGYQRRKIEKSTEGCPNKILFCQRPARILDEASKGNVDLVVVGEFLFNSYNPFRPNENSFFSCGELARQLHRINKDIVVLAYSPYRKDAEYMVNIDMGRIDGSVQGSLEQTGLVGMLNDTILSNILRTEHYELLESRYGINVRRYSNMPVAAPSTNILSKSLSW